MSTEHIFRALQLPNGQIGISVVPEMAASFHDFLTKNQVKCSDLSEETFEVRDVYRDEAGNPVAGDFGMVKVFTASASMQRIADLGGQWPSTWGK